MSQARDANTLVLAERQEVGISRDNKLSFGGEGTSEHLIVVDLL